MIGEMIERSKKKGKPEDLTYRAVTPEEERRCRKAENMKNLAIPGMIIGSILSLVLCGYIFYACFESAIIISIAAVVFFVAEIVVTILRWKDLKKSISYEIAEGEIHSLIKTKHRTYVVAWCEKDELCVSKFRYLSAFVPLTGKKVLLVRGDRGEGRKPSYFAIAPEGDPMTN